MSKKYLLLLLVLPLTLAAYHIETDYFITSFRDFSGGLNLFSFLIQPNQAKVLENLSAYGGSSL